MSRLFKSAFFPILIVVVLAFFAQKLISPGGHTPRYDYSSFQQDLRQGQVKSVDVKTKDNTLALTLTDGQKHEVGYHSDFHSVQPTPALFLSSQGWYDGVHEFDRREHQGLLDVARITGQVCVCVDQAWKHSGLGQLKYAIP